MSATAAIQEMLAEHGYVADRQVVMSVYLAQTLERPLLIEGPAGVGKTEVAKVIARALDTELIRLQCYEGLDAYARAVRVELPAPALAQSSSTKRANAP